jgi:hypothetical protein
MARYVVRGTVRDEIGNPVEGAAIEIGTDVVFTNSTGQFFHRLGRPGRLPVKVSTAEFLLPGQWEVLSAPTEAVAGSETAQGIEIILRHPAAITQ